MIIAGTLYDAGGTLPSIKIRFRAQQTTLNGVVQSSVKDFETQPDGTYSINLEPGYYSVYWVEERSVVPLGTLVADETSEKTLPQALGSSAVVPVTEEQAEDFISVMIAARDAAQASANSAATSASQVEFFAEQAEASATAANSSATSANDSASLAGQHAARASVDAQATAADRMAIEQDIAQLVWKGELGEEIVTSPEGNLLPPQHCPSLVIRGRGSSFL